MVLRPSPIDGVANSSRLSVQFCSMIPLCACYDFYHLDNSSPNAWYTAVNKESCKLIGPESRGRDDLL